MRASHKLYTSRQVRGVDYAAIHEFDIAGYELMTRAAAAVVEHANTNFGSARRWLLVCGPGNNGGDGYVIARLATDAGIDVSVCSLVDPALLKGDAATAWADWHSTGGKLLAWPLKEDFSTDLVIDAVLGTGISRSVEGEYLHAIRFINAIDCPKIAVDVPSGLNADTGCVMGEAVRAESTVTFVAQKRGMYTANGPDHCGSIVFDDLAIPKAAEDSMARSLGEGGFLLEPGLLAGMMKPRARNSHKGRFGHVLAVGGMAGMSGAIRLCGEAALRSGAGRVTLVTDPVHAAFINLGRPELMVKAVTGGTGLREILEPGHVVAVGPGLGLSQWAESLFQQCFDAATDLVVDADALNLLARRSNKAPLVRKNWVLTPHPAEAARLLDCEPAEIQQDRIAAAQTLASRFNACVVLKGCGTVIASIDGEYAICAAGNPGMATAGSGDVLTGVIAALLGQGLSCWQAALAGVLAHAEAGDLAATRLGETALIAGDITAHLAPVWKAAESNRGRLTS